MKYIDFGYSNASKSTGLFEGIGLGMRENGKAIGPVKGELIDVITVGEKDYLITKTTMAFGDDPRFMGKIDVREVIVDLYPDGSGIIFLDQEDSYGRRELASYLNKPQNVERIEKGVPIQEFCQCNKAKYAYECILRRDIGSVEVPVTAITHELFEEKKNLINSCHTSISGMMEQISLLNGQERSR